MLMTAGSRGIELTRHGISLIGIGLLLLAGLAVGGFSAVDLSRSLFAASVPSAGCVGYTLFYRPPEMIPENNSDSDG